MVLLNKAFEKYINSYTSQKTRDRSKDSSIKELIITENEITAKVKGSKIYVVTIQYNKDKVKTSKCSCPFDMGPVCKHVVNVLINADTELSKSSDENESDISLLKLDDNYENKLYHPTDFIFENFSFSELTNTFILKNSLEFANDGKRGYFDLQVLNLKMNQGTFKDSYSFYKTLPIAVKFLNNNLIVSCACNTLKKKMCEHQVQLMYNIKDRNEIRVFFDEILRKEILYSKALDYGLENEPFLDSYFQLEYFGRELEIRPKIKEILPVNATTKKLLEQNLLSDVKEIKIGKSDLNDSKLFIVFGQHRYYDYIFIELLEAKLTKEGQVKNPLVTKNPIDYVWKSDDKNELKFYSGLVKFQNNAVRNSSLSDIEALKSIVLNPLNLDAYYHDSNVSDTIKSTSIIPVELNILESDLILDVNQKDSFYEVSGRIDILDKTYELRDLKLKYNYFILAGKSMYLMVNPDYIRVINFFKKNNQKILIHESKFKEFQETILANLEHKVKINYSYLKPATKKQIKDFSAENTKDKTIYLSDSDDYVIISPVVKYGEIEVPLFSKKQVYSSDAKGNTFLIDRDDELEIRFMSILLRQHPYFEDQLEQGFFYVHKQEFLHEGWFFDVFEKWRDEGITILGFSDLKNNRLNSNKASISVSVNSGLDWFDTSLKVKFGDQEVSLKQLQKSVKNRSKFIELGDGTLGLLPEEWIEKFSRYFRSGEIGKDSIRTHKMNFSEVSELYEEEVLTKEAREQLAYYKSKMASFQSIQSIAVPKELNATLREYQKEGLNWLNFLDEFEFGGCLADDMGLGKTIQIIAFILSQRVKVRKNTNLIVVPTSLIFNWQAEVEKFAPSIKIHTIYGVDRIKNTYDFDKYEIILTSYGTLLSDIRFLKEYTFNYIFLDESQAIKNPESQRYKSVRLLKSRNKIVLTGTPIENNTFDLYGQFSFACPGLLGNKQAFQDNYSAPIDKFKDTRRAIELQKKINPFLLRRTKAQVAKELPDKTEMVIYCEMEEEQRKVYDSYKQEFKEFLMASKSQKKYMDTMYMLAGLTKLRQICNSPALINDQEFYGDSSAKLRVLMEEINSKSAYHKIIVFSQFVSMLDLIKIELEKSKIPFEYLTGKTINRQNLVEEFQTNSEVRVFLISLKAGGTGLNLTEADYVYLVDPWWNPAVENQAIDRCYRIGQKKNVVAVRLICPDTIEEKIMKLQESKKELVNDLIKTDASILKSLSKEDLIGFFD
jgi:SNF2 family DNA or RNA helicase